MTNLLIYFYFLICQKLFILIILLFYLLFIRGKRTVEENSLSFLEENGYGHNVASSIITFLLKQLKKLSAIFK